MTGCCVIPLQYDGSGVSTLGSCAHGGGGYCGTAMFKMVGSFFSAAVFFLRVTGWGWMGLGSGGLL